MNSLTIVAIAIVILVAGYALYGRWLAKTWGIDPKAKTPAYTHEDGEDYIPTFLQTAGPFSHISFHPSQVQVLLPDRSSPQCLDGCQFFSGC